MIKSKTRSSGIRRIRSSRQARRSGLYKSVNAARGEVFVAQKRDSKRSGVVTIKRQATGDFSPRDDITPRTAYGNFPAKTWRIKRNGESDNE